MSPSDAAIEMLAALQVQILGFGLLFGAASGLYHKRLIRRGHPRGLASKPVLGRLCIGIGFLFGLSGIGQLSVSSGPAMLIAFAVGAGYGVVRVLGTVIVFRRVRYLIAGHIGSPISPRRKAIERWASGIGALLLLGTIGFWGLHSQNVSQFGITGLPPLMVLLLFSGMFWPVDKGRLNGPREAAT
jgi:hypothetical protein